VAKQPINAATSSDLVRSVSFLANSVLIAIIVATLHFGREIFVPIALAVLLSFVLAPLVALLQAARVPRGFAVVGVVIIAFSMIFMLGGLLASQITQLADDIPRYQSTISAKIQSFREKAPGRGTLERASGMLKDLSKELDRPKETGKAGLPAGTTSDLKAATVPVPVEVRPPDPGPLEGLRGLISPLLHPLAMTGLVIIFVIFVLLQREDLRNRLIRLAGSHDLQRTTAALDDAARRLSRLYLTQLVVNSGFGAVIGIGLWVIGIPSALLWGMLAGVLRFVPYIGAFIAAAFPLVLAVAVDPGWSMLVWTLTLFLVVEPIVGHVLEPMVYGHSSGLSPIAVVASATFWTALWGPIGLVLATPLTVCLVVLGRHVERLEFLDVLLGDRPSLSPPEVFYQRMLAGDPTEAAEKAEAFLKDRPLSAYYDEVALKGLQLAQFDANRGVLHQERLERIKEAIDEFVSDLSDGEAIPPKPHKSDDPEAPSAEEGNDDHGESEYLPILAKAELPSEWQGEHPVLCVAGRSLLDEAAALMLGHLSTSHGLTARVEPAEALSTASLFRLDIKGVAIVCLVYLDVSSPAHMRYSVRRLRRKSPKATIMLNCWVNDLDQTELEKLRESASADLAAASPSQAIRMIIEATATRNDAKNNPSAVQAAESSGTRRQA
jgi:predicted PurR-regulated permease PerM